MMLIWIDCFAAGYVLVMAALGIYAQSSDFIIASVLGLMCATAATCMTKWCDHHKEVSEKWIDLDKAKSGL